MNLNHLENTLSKDIEAMERNVKDSMRIRYITVILFAIHDKDECCFLSFLKNCISIFHYYDQK